MGDTAAAVAVALDGGQSATGRPPADALGGDQSAEGPHPASGAAPSAASMFHALVAEMKSHPGSSQIDAWLLTIKDLFAVEFEKLPINATELPASKARYPRLRASEASSLLRLFEQAFVASAGTFNDWKKLASALGKDLVLTKWAFTAIVRRLTSQHKWAQAPVLNQWAQVVKQGTSTPKGSRDSPSNPKYEDFMFDPSKFTHEEAEHLKAICEDRSFIGHKVSLREGTNDEWRIITGIAEGHIVCRRMPLFFKAVLDSQERLRLYSTVQAQVEGHLALSLGPDRGIPISRQTTRSITETILESAELSQVSLPELHQFFSLTKTINYDRATKSLHFFFFSRETAERLKHVRIPYRGRVYTLSNAHRPERGSVWGRQQGPTGHTWHQRAEYTIVLHNLTRFNEIGRVAAYLKSKIPTAFEFEDLDTYCPMSRTSTSWRVTFQLSGCPTFLQGIVRLLWFGTPIILQHPDVGRRLQCLQCGELGHTAARCGYTDIQLKGPGGIEVHESDLSNLADLAKPFSSVAEMRRMAADRLTVQKSAEVAASAAVTPPVIPSAQAPGPAASLSRDSDRASSVYTPVSRAASGSGPAPVKADEQPWITQPLRGSQNPWAQALKAPSRSKISSGRYSVLEQVEEPSTTDNDSPMPSNSADKSGTEAVRPRPRPTPDRQTQAEVSGKRQALSRGKAPTLSGPVLLTMKSQERVTCERILGSLKDGPTRALSMEHRPQRVPSNMRSLVRLLGLREVVTPATGNCMAMAVAQAYVDASMLGESDAFERLTASVKRGIRFTGLLNLELNYAHDVRVQALRNVGRGWTTMTPKDSANQFRWFLHDYASSPSDRTSTIDGTVWGGVILSGWRRYFFTGTSMSSTWEMRKGGPIVAESIARP